ncbi:MAG: phage holin family protein [Eubacterium sp.]
MRDFLQIAAVITGGLLSFLFGGLDDLFKTLLLLMSLDYMTGVIKGISRHTLSSAIGFKGILKKIMILIIIATAFAMQRVIGVEMPIRDMTVLFYLTNEAISLLENISEFIPVPRKLKMILLKFKEEEEKKNENN